MQNDSSSHTLAKHPKTFFQAVCNRCETWYLTLKEENRLRMFENRVLRRIFGPKWEEVTEE
jgi:hypothetical protein